MRIKKHNGLQATAQKRFVVYYVSTMPPSSNDLVFNWLFDKCKQARLD